MSRSSSEFQGAAGPVSHVTAPPPIGGAMPPEERKRVMPASQQNYGLSRLTAWEAPQGAAQGSLNRSSYLDFNQEKPDYRVPSNS